MTGIISPAPGHSPELTKQTLSSEDIIEMFELSLRGAYKVVKEDGSIEIVRYANFKQKLTEEGIQFLLRKLRAFVNRNRFLSSYENFDEVRMEIESDAEEIIAELYSFPEKYLIDSDELFSIVPSVVSEFIDYAKPAAYRAVQESDKKFLGKSVSERTENINSPSEKEKKGFFGLFGGRG